MAKKKPVSKNDKVIKTKPAFKPGDKPYYEYEGVVLNANVPWCELILELKEWGQTCTSIAQYAECSPNVVSEILNSDYANLCFRAGARIITLHSNSHPNIDE